MLGQEPSISKKSAIFQPNFLSFFSQAFSQSFAVTDQLSHYKSWWMNLCWFNNTHLTGSHLLGIHQVPSSRQIPQIQECGLS